MTSTTSKPKSGRGRRAAHPSAPAHHAAAHKVAPQGERGRFTHAEIRAIIFGLMLAMFLGALDQTIVATALPTIGSHFGDLGDLPWVVTAYLITGTAVTPLYGKLSDMHGRRLMMLTAIALFTLGSLACALAPNMTALIWGRALQGLGGGGLMALAQTIIADIVSPRERGRYQGYIAAVFATASVGGPVLGGFLTEHLNWSLIFWINLPMGLGALGMTSDVLKRVPFHPRQRRLDLVGAVLMMLAAVALLLALSWGGRRFDWASLQIGTLLTISAVLWSLFAWRLMATPDPFLPLSVLGDSVVRYAALAGACTMATLVGLTIFMPLYFAVVLHLSAGQSGLALIPLMGSTVVFATVSGRLTTHVVHYKRLPMIGIVVAILSLAALAIWPTTLSIVRVLTLLTLVGSGLGSVFPISTVCLQNAVAHSQMGIATGTANFFRALFSALVVAILGAIVLGGLGGTTGAAVETVAHVAMSGTLARAFSYLFAACALVQVISMGLLFAMDERVLKGPAAHAAAFEVPTAPATPISE